MNSGLDVVIWDVQHGSAVYVKTPGGKHIAIDLGTGSYGYSDKNFSPLSHLHDRYGVHQLDAVIITHPHRDHLDDIHCFNALAPKVLMASKHLQDSDMYDGNAPESRHIIEKYIEIRKRYNADIPWESGNNPFSAANNGGVNIRCFIPNTCARSNLNNHSVVAVLEYASHKMIIPGDNEPASWSELLSSPDFKKAIQGTTVFVASHHGRESGFSSDLLQCIQPYLTIISDGAYCDTSATSRYSQKSRGWNVKKRSGGSESRNCVTTRNDGVVYISLEHGADGQSYMEVSVD